jgi:hypothetical protein
MINVEQGELMSEVSGLHGGVDELNFDTEI